MKIQILDQGKGPVRANWRETTFNDGDDFKLFADDQYIGAGTLDSEGNLIIVSTLHKIEFRKEN